MIDIQLTATGFSINNKPVSFPISLAALENIFAEKPRHFKGKKGGVYTWDKLGILGYSKEAHLIYALSITFEAENYQFSPSQTFAGSFSFEDEAIASYYHQHPEKRVKLFDGDTSGALVLNTISAWFDDSSWQ